MNQSVPLFRKILAVTDFSDCARTGLDQAVQLGKLTGAEVTLAHVVPLTQETMEGMAANPWYAAANVEEIEERLRHGADERLKAELTPYQDSGVALHVKTLWGVPFVEIIHAVQEEGYDLTVVGTRGRSPISRFLVGSTATRLVRKCPCPVWIAKPHDGRPLRSILAPIDYSEASQKSLRMAAALAAEAEGLLHVLHVYNDDRELQMLALVTDEESSERRKLMHRHAVEGLEQFVEQMQLPVRPTLHVERGETWKRVVAASRRLDADLTVMGTVGRGGVSGLMIGNTAEKVMHVEEGPLLAVKPEGFVSPVPPRSKLRHALRD
ncbi:MAG TPA: universal stress protein [Pirellulales bacterium]|nr:universal stress protein [Pirellulales bacterium]